MNREWAAQRAPYAWNVYPDCTKQAEIAAELVTKQLVGRQRPATADRTLRDTTRKFAIVAPDSITMQVLPRDPPGRALDAAGVSARTVTYALDLGTIQTLGRSRSPRRSPRTASPPCC